MGNLSLPLSGSLSSGGSVFEVDCDGGGGTAIVGKSLGGDPGGYGGTGVAGSAEDGGIAVSGVSTGLDRDSVGGAGVWASSEGGVGVVGIASGEDREGLAVGVEGFAPIAISGIANNPTGFAFQAQGHASQDLGSSGWLKAAVYLAGSPTKSIKRAFNSQLPGGGSGVANAGFKLTRHDSGVYIVDFGFQISDRFVCAIVEPGPSGADPTNPDSRFPSFDVVSQKFFIVNTYLQSPSQILVITWAPQAGFASGSGGLPLFQGFLPTEANVTLMVF